MLKKLRDELLNVVQHRLFSIAIFVILIAAGFICVLIPFAEFTTLRDVALPAVGASLVAAGVVGVMTYAVIEPATSRRLQSVIESIVGAPARILGEKINVSKRYSDLTSSGKEIDIISLTLDAFVQVYNRREIRKWVINSNKSFRLLVLEPDGHIAAMRGAEEGGANLERKIDSSLSTIGDWCKTLRDELDKSSDCKGRLEVRTYSGLPHFAYFRSDDEILVSLYYRNLPGQQSEVISIRRRGSITYEKMIRHFNAAWKSGTTKKECCLGVKESEYYSPEELQQPEDVNSKEGGTTHDS